jgi:plasmid stabilization system protein ParE
MTTLSFSRRAFADLDHFTDFLLESADSVVDVITNAVLVLARHPYIGRQIEHGLRELVISRGRSGYVALYEFDRARDEIVVHALRHQLEAGYANE